ncbi:hypothetical protein Pmar_PMAR011410, partial [Perkinsus marinus ATCC 50983]
VLCRSLHDLSLSAEATTKSRKLFEFAANDFDLSKCDSASLCELAKAMLRCKDTSIEKKKVFSRLCSTRTAVDDPDVLVAIAISGVWDSEYFIEASQRQLKMKSKSAERSIYVYYAIAYGLNVLYCCAHLVHRLDTGGSDNGMSQEAVNDCLVRALWALGMLNVPLMKLGKAVVTLIHQLSKRMGTLSVSNLVNLMIPLCVFMYAILSGPSTLLKQHGGSEVLNAACGRLVEALTVQLAKSYRPDWMATAAKALYFARVVGR